MTMQTDQLFGYDVYTQDGDKLGAVDNVWVDDATDQTEFIGVKTGWLFGKTHIIPTADAQISGNTVTIPYGKDQIEGAPSFDADAEISPDEEQQVYRYYGLGRSTAPSPSGLPAGDTTGYSDTATQRTVSTGDMSGTDLPTPPTEADVTLSEEELAVGKRTVQTGQARLRKVVRTEHREVPVDLRREDIEIERIPAGEVSDATATGQAFQEQTIDVPLMAEEPVVEKQAHVTGGVRMTKTVETDTQTVGGDVRSEDVEVDQNADESTAGRDF